MLCLLLILQAVYGQVCVQRTEWTQLNQQDKNKYFAGVRCLQRWASPTGQGSVYDDFVRVHLRVSSGTGFMAHNNPAFLPWHRGFLLAFERALRSCTQDPTFFVPYWDSSRDNLRRSIVVRDFGGNGDLDNGTCVDNGPFSVFRPFAPTSRSPCLSRNIGSGNVATVEFVAMVMNEPFSGFVQLIEQGTHAAVHNGIGGDMMTFSSPNDPLFFLHHSFIDKLWADYQTRGNFQTDSFDRIGFRSSNIMPYFELSWLLSDRPVTAFLSIQTLCYTYSNTFATPSINIQSVAPEDRDLLKLPLPEPLSEDYIRSQGFDVAQVRRMEKVQSDVITYYNSIDGYVSPSAPYFQKYAPDNNRRPMSNDEVRMETDLLDALAVQAKKVLNLPPNISDYIRQRLNQAIDDHINNDQVEDFLHRYVNMIFK